MLFLTLPWLAQTSCGLPPLVLDIPLSSSKCLLITKLFDIGPCPYLIVIWHCFSHFLISRIDYNLSLTLVTTHTSFLGLNQPELAKSSWYLQISLSIFCSNQIDWKVFFLDWEKSDLIEANLFNAGKLKHSIIIRKIFFKFSTEFDGH